MIAPAPLLEARHALDSGDNKRCANLAGRFLQVEGPHGEALFLMGLGLVGMGQRSLGVQAIENAITLEPHCEYMAQLARLYSMVMRENDARRLADQAWSALPSETQTSAITFDTLGCVYALLGEHGNARSLFARATALDPDNAGFRNNYAISLSFFNETAEATAQYEAILAQNPHSGDAFLGLSGLQKATATAHHLELMEAALTEALPENEALRTHFAAAKEYEDLGEATQAFAHITQGSVIHRAMHPYSLADDQRLAERIMQVFGDPSYFNAENLDAHTRINPVFIIGLPRTGTTLVDTILSSHPDLTSAGELPCLPVALKALVQTASPALLDSETIEALRHANPADLAQAYTHRSSAYSNTSTGHFTDKLPANFLNIGYIARAFPNAPIICLKRDPMDVIWSTYKMLFSSRNASYGWSYAVETCAEYYTLFDRMMAFWEDLFPGRIHTVGYEQLIHNPETEIPALLRACNLQQHDNCLRFYEQKSSVATPSSQQVRHPLSTSSIGKWRAYAEQLAPAQQILTQYGICVN